MSLLKHTMSDKNKTVKPQPKWAELLTTAPADLFTLAKAGVKLATALESAKAEFTGSVQFQAKVVAALKVAHRQAVDTRAISPSTSFKDYFKGNCGGDLPGRIEAVANVWNELVETGNLTEDAFDAAAVDWLEKTSAILNAEKKANPQGYLASENVRKACEAMSKPGDALKAIKEIRAAQTAAKKAAETAGGPAPLDPKMVDLSTTDGLLRGICLVGAELRSFKDGTRLREVIEAMKIAGEMMEANPLVADFFAAEIARADEAANARREPLQLPEMAAA